MNTREKICAWLFEITKTPYAFVFKRNKEAWKLNSTILLTYPVGSLGHEVGLFLQKNNIELIDKLESHDVYHVITDMSTSVRDEVGMQFLLLGNGKHSVYQFSTIGICIFLLPEHFKHFIRCYKKGKKYKGIHQLVLKEELHNQLTHIQKRLMNKTRASQVRCFGLLNDHTLS